jgi:hypothetical protein
MEESTMTATTIAAAVPDPFWRRMRAVALWSVVLGVGIELVLIAIAAAATKAPDAAHAFAQIAQKVSWSFIVCAGISSGLALTSGRPRAMGLLGFLSGPIGFIIARSVHKSALQALSDAPLPPEAISPAVMAGLRAAEYLVFGVWIGWILSSGTPSFGRYARAAVVIGVVFGAVFLGLFIHARPNATMGDLIPKGLNELLFPVGCAGVLYVARKMSTARAA